VPSLGGVDISPVILFILLQAMKIVIARTLAPLAVGLLG
jgi:uncharacterized protein YggT (Ycf19 family)